MARKRSCCSRLCRGLRRHLWRHLHQYLLLLLFAGAAGYGVCQYGAWTARQLELNRLNLPQAALPEAGPLSIALISDIHDNRDLLERCVEWVERERPDLILLAGDYIVRHKTLGRTRKLIEPLRRLRAVAPTYAILGNHDYEKLDQVERILAAAGIPLLRNAATTWQTPSGAPLLIAGLGDYNEADEAPESCLPPKGQAGCPVLLLSHDPESRHALYAYDWQLMLSGHTHGGQLGVPFSRKPICFRSDMPSGYYIEAGRHHVVTRGVGSIFDVRLFSRPEMLMLRVGAEEDKVQKAEIPAGSLRAIKRAR